MKILVVEDEPALRDALVDLLEGDGHTVEAVADGDAGAERGTDPSFDLVLLDLMLPKRDGVEVCKVIREQNPDVHVLMLTARADEDDKVRGLSVGADDYVTKPFGARELLARVQAVYRRRVPSPVEEITIDGCAMQLSLCRARRDDEEIKLTAREVAILRLLHAHSTRAVSRAELLEKVWNTTGDLATRTVDMTIANLRQKIERDPSNPSIIVTIKGVGYAWGAES